MWRRNEKNVKTLWGLSIMAGLLLFAMCSPQYPTRQVSGWTAKTVVSGLEYPWGLAFLPDGDMLITERPGRLRLVREGKLVEEPIAGVPEVFAANQGGLLDVALDPNFAQNRFVYLTYSAGVHQSNQTRVARGRLNHMRLEYRHKGRPERPTLNEGEPCHKLLA